jgi:hypothetical protein
LDGTNAGGYMGIRSGMTASTSDATQYALLVFIQTLAKLKKSRELDAVILV